VSDVVEFEIADLVGLHILPKYLVVDSTPVIDCVGSLVDQSTQSTWQSPDCLASTFQVSISHPSGDGLPVRVVIGRALGSDSHTSTLTSSLGDSTTEALYFSTTDLIFDAGSGFAPQSVTVTANNEEFSWTTTTSTFGTDSTTFSHHYYSWRDFEGDGLFVVWAEQYDTGSSQWKFTPEYIPTSFQVVVSALL